MFVFCFLILFPEAQREEYELVENPPRDHDKNASFTVQDSYNVLVNGRIIKENC